VGKFWRGGTAGKSGRSWEGYRAPLRRPVALLPFVQSHTATANAARPIFLPSIFYCTPALTAEELYISMLATATVFFELLKLPATVTPWPANLAAMT